MARVGIHGRMVGFVKDLGEAIPQLEYIHDAIENALNGQIDSTNLADAAVTASKLAASSVTSAAVDSTVPKITTNQYTGDGTVSREINLGYRARFVFIVNHTTRVIFFALGGTLGAFVRIQISAAGVITDGGTDFTGCSTNGFTLGSAAGGGNSNTAATVYSYAALG